MPRWPRDERAANEARFAEHAASSYTGDTMEKRMLVAKRDNALDALRPRPPSFARLARSFPNRRLSPRSTRIRPIGRSPPPSGSPHVRLCTPDRNSMLLSVAPPGRRVGLGDFA